MRTPMILTGLGLALCMAAPAASAQQYRHDNRGERDHRGDIVRCESRDDRRRDCQADTRGGVQLVRQHSAAACVRGRSWGADGRGIWVDHGCRADFVVGARRARWEREAVVAQAFRCESDNHRERVCHVPGGGRVQLVRQLSDTRCIEGRTWGQDGNRVWVDDGCRGEFQSTGNRGDWSRWRGSRGY